ncbi:sensor histidine kinase [Microtetraspora malaysiensis]|uniref:sensor histidine kinase n=1 Tax=Microtetraspora malaysiensis TaxID=161358 RepID=UPI003D8CD0D2
MSSEDRYRLVAPVLLVILLIVMLAQIATWLAWPSMTTLGDPGLLALGCVFASALVLVRRRWPLVALLGAAVLFGRFIETGVALAVIAYGAAGRAPVRGVAWALTGALPTAVALALTPLAAWRQVAVVMVTISVICLAVPGLVGLIVVQRERLVHALRERNDGLERAHELTASRARLLERSRIAQEMHDLIGHRLSLISLYAGGLELSATPPLAERSRLVRDTAATAMSELRTVLEVLRGGADEPSDGLTDATGTRADVERLIGESQAAGANVSFRWTGPDVGQEHRAVRMAAHRLVREALTNLHRHAPGAACQVQVQHEPHELALVVENGPWPGTTADGSGSGLAGLGERVRLLGGTFTAGRLLGGGFRVLARLPWNGAAFTGPAVKTPSPAEGAPPRGGSRAGLALVHAAGVAAVAVFLGTALAYLPLPSRAAMIDVGMADSALRRAVGASEPVAELAAAGHEPPRPEGARCWYFYAGYDITADPVRIVRYCLNGERIVDKRLISVRVGAGR